MSKNIVVVGGGTAGWLTALISKKVFPEDNICLVESSDIGILGAGEGSTPHLLDMMLYLDISLQDLVKNTSCTIKNGILFDGWSNSRRPYLHGFDIYDQRFQRESLNFNSNILEWTNAPVVGYLAEYFGIEDDEVDILTYNSIRNKVFFNKDFVQEGISAIHFDARSLAEFLKNKALDRGIKRIEGLVSEVSLDEEGNVSYVNLNGDHKIFGDFFFDCTGFARMIIGKVYNSEWVSFKEILPANRAMPFFLERDKDIPPYTLSKAMKSGWMWKIPLQHRYGCGYVYDSNQISDEGVKDEIDNLIGEEVHVPKIFKFDPGYYKKVWIKNCLALGLANGFVEPLEATSIMQMLISAKAFFEQKHMIFTNNEQFKDSFNSKIERDQIEIASFIYLHYLTDRKDSEFWADFSKRHMPPDSIKHTLQRIYYGLLGPQDSSEGFDTASYLTVARGNGILKKQNIDNIYSTLLKEKSLEPYLHNLINQIPKYSERFIFHKDFLKHLGANFD